MKDFEKWCSEKKFIHSRTGIPNFKEREIWFVKMGVNIGAEQDGGKNFLRPVLIVKRFPNNTFLALPLTKKKRKGSFYHNFVFKGKESTVILTQIRLLDARRLVNKKGRLSEKEFNLIKIKLRDLIL